MKWAATTLATQGAPGGGKKNNTVQVIGAALNSVTSLFNNSCDVNTVKFHQGRKTVMLARCRHISVISVSYQCHISVISVSSNQSDTLSHQEGHQGRRGGLRLLWPTLFPGRKVFTLKAHLQGKCKTGSKHSDRRLHEPSDSQR